MRLANGYLGCLVHSLVSFQPVDGPARQNGLGLSQRIQEAAPYKLLPTMQKCVLDIELTASRRDKAKVKTVRTVAIFTTGLKVSS